MKHSRKRKPFCSIQRCGIGIFCLGLSWTLTFLHITRPDIDNKLNVFNEHDISKDLTDAVDDLKEKLRTAKGNTLQELIEKDSKFKIPEPRPHLKPVDQGPTSETDEEAILQKLKPPAPEELQEHFGKPIEVHKKHFPSLRLLPRQEHPKKSPMKEDHTKVSPPQRQDITKSGLLTASAYGKSFSNSKSHNPKNIFAPSDEEFQAMYPNLHVKVQEYKERHLQAFDICQKGGQGLLDNFKILVLDNHSGMGNQMLAHVSAFLLALLTKSVLVVKGNTYSHDVFADPGFDMRFSSWNKCSGHLGRGKSSLDLTIQKDTKAAQKLLCTDIVNGLFAKNGAITLRGNVYIAPYLQFNKFTRDQVYQLFSTSKKSPRYTLMETQYKSYYDNLKAAGIGYNETLAYDLSIPPELDMAAPLSRFILTPHPEVFAYRDRMLSQEYGSRNGSLVTYVVGVQMRTDGHDVFVKEDETWRRFARCGHLETFLKVDGGKTTQHKMMIATDTADARYRTDKIYSKFQSPISKKAVSYFFSSKQFLKSNTRAGKQEAVLDLLLLSEADELVITPRSTFGYWAAAWGGHRPLMIHHWIIPKDVRHHSEQALTSGWKGKTFFMGIPNTIPHGDMKYCVRRQSFEPVMHPIDQMKLGELTCHPERIQMADELMFHGRYW